MTQTIESFVTRLQEEGIQAGQQEAQRIRQEAQQQAQQAVEQAKAQARQIIEQAQAQGKTSLERARTELQLACRDAILRLRDALNNTLRAVLGRHVGAKLADPEFLGQTLHELVRMYAQSDLEHRGFEMNVPPNLQEQLSGWLLAEISRDAVQGEHYPVSLKGTLHQAGFEYRVNGATVEVTQESVVQMLCELVSPRLREVIDEAVGQTCQGN